MTHTITIVTRHIDNLGGIDPNHPRVRKFLSSEIIGIDIRDIPFTRKSQLFLLIRGETEPRWIGIYFTDRVQGVADRIMEAAITPCAIRGPIE